MIKKLIDYIKRLNKRFIDWHNNQDLLDKYESNFREMEEDLRKVLNR